jgi:integrase
MTRIKLDNVHEYRDRHGKVRRYVRRRGFRAVPLPGLPGTPEFMAAYHAALTSATVQPSTKPTAGTLAAVVSDFYRSAEFANLKSSSQVTYRLVLDRIVRADGHRLVRDLPTDKARKIIEEIGVKRPGMANLTRAVMRRVISFAIDMGLRTDNPFDRVPKYRLGTHHTWTDDQIAAFENRWPLGTRQRVAFALLLYTGQRVGDVVRMRRSDIRDGAVHLVQGKTGAELHIDIHPALARALTAAPSNGLHLIGDRDGRPITSGRLSGLIVEAARAAGLPSECVAHGLRKAALRRLAEGGATTKEIAAVSGHQSLSEIERYTRKADQARLARSAIGRLPDKE